MKRWVMIGSLALMLIPQSSLSWADDRVRGRWEGIAIGLGAVSLYNLFQHGQLSPVIPSQRSYPERRIDRYPPVICEPFGHWEIRPQWVPERKDYLWIPDHQEGRYWVKGHYEVRIYPGHYEERKVWVEGPSR
jgi:hypothetical protein